MRLVAVLLVAPAVTAQASGLPPLDHVAHTSALRAERIGLFFEAWEEADDERRAATERLLEHDPSFGGVRDAWPDADLLARAMRRLIGDGSQAAAFVDALDLRVVPGALDAGGRGQPVRAHAFLRHSVAPPAGARLRLVWSGPGGERKVERELELAADSFQSGPSTWILRAPGEAPARWRLVPELVDGEAVSVGLGVPVERVEDFAARLGALDPGAPGRDRLLALAERGVLIGGELGVGERLALAEGGEPAPFEGPLRSRGAPDAETVVAVVGRPDETPETLFAGRLGRAWSELVEISGCRLVALAREEVGVDRFGATLAGLRASAPGARLVLVARGRAVLSLHLAFGGLRGGDGGGELVDALVLSSTMPPGPVLPDVPILFVQPEGEQRREVRGERVVVVTGARFAFLSELELPRHVSHWLEEL